jgi:hypothetical protein
LIGLDLDPALMFFIAQPLGWVIVGILTIHIARG